MKQAPCPLCNYQEAESSHLPAKDGYLIRCPRCGEFAISGSAIHSKPANYWDEGVYLISGKTRQLWETTGKQYFVNSYILPSGNSFRADILSNTPQTVNEKITSFLKMLSLKTSFPGETITLFREKDFTLAFCKNKEEFGYYINHMENIGLINNSGTLSNESIQILPEGWTYLERVDETNLESNKAFVAMWFDREADYIFDAINSLDDDLKEDEDPIKFTFTRVDGEEYNGDVCDKILSMIKNSRFVIADYTGNRSGVYFEAGFARGLGIPVIYTCHNDYKDKIHFDINHFNFIFWGTVEELKTRLRNRILATVGRAK
jgi:hypothetical protein